MTDKDWTGSSKSIYRTLAATGHSDGEREQNDYYATDPKAIDMLYPHYQIPLKIWEPACGEGHLSKRLEELGHIVYSSDLVDRGYGHTGIDFLKTTKQDMPDCECILTNPPYKYCTEFIEHSLDLLEPGQPAIMFLKTLTLEGKERFEKLYSKGYLKSMYQFVSRIACGKNGELYVDGKYIGSAVAYAWYIFTKERNDTRLYWLN